MAATRSSLCQAARSCTIPVAKRASCKLMHELDFITNRQQQAPDAVVAEYVDMYGADLPEQAIKAIKAAARLGNKNLAKVLEAMVESDGIIMEA